MAVADSEYASGWNDAVKRCSTRLEALARDIEEAGSAAIARAMRRLVAEIRGTEGGRGRPPKVSG